MNISIHIPEFAMVLLIGASGSGKSTFARRHFLSTEIISSDLCRAMISDDENNQKCTGDAFDVLHLIVSKRLKARKLAVVDATNVQEHARSSLISLARQYGAPVVAIVLNLSPELCVKRHKLRSDRDFAEQVIWTHYRQLQQSLSDFPDRGVLYTYYLNSEEDVNKVRIVRDDVSQVAGKDIRDEDIQKFDVIGDIHGCFDEFMQLLNKLDYRIEKKENYKISHPENRRLAFVGDLVDRGPASPDVMRFVMDCVEDGTAFCVTGNHDDKLMRKLMGRDVQVAHGLRETLDQLEDETTEFVEKSLKFLQDLPSHHVLDNGRLAVVHAALKESYLGHESKQIREYCMFGPTTGELDEHGLPIRLPWAQDYHGETLVVFGHTPVQEPAWQNQTVNIDTGCVYGGRLTALRYPEKEFVSVKAAKVYYEALRKSA